MRLLAYVVLPNHWHLVVWPQTDGEWSVYVQRLTVTHVRRWHANHHTGGTGPVYQGRFKSFPVQEDDHFFTVCRYVERNPLRANLVARAESWRWSSLWHRFHHTGVPWLSAWPLPLPDSWLQHVNGAETESELAALRSSVVRGAPFGEPTWQQRTALLWAWKPPYASQAGQEEPNSLRKTNPDPFVPFLPNFFSIRQ
jgi:putative transposase